MSKTNQLDAHYAVIQLDELRRQVVLSFRPTVDLLVAEVRERSPYSLAERDRLRGLLTRYRAAVLELADILVELRAQCGTDPADLPDADGDGGVLDEYVALRRTHEAADRKGGAR